MSRSGTGKGRAQERGGLGWGQARASLVHAAARRCAAKMAASGWARAAVVFLCACDLMLLLLLPPRAFAAEGPAETPGEATPPPRKKKKDIRDYNDADMARLLEQWEVRSARTPSRLFCPESLPSDLLPPLSWDPLHLRLGVFRPLNLLCPHANGPYDPLQLPLTLSPLTTSPSVCRPPPQAVHPNFLFSPFLGPLQSRVRLSLFSPICHQCPGRLRVAPRGQRALLMNGGGRPFPSHS